MRLIDPNTGAPSPRGFGAFAVLIITAIVGITVLFGSWYTVDQRERVVVTRNGQVVDEAGPGLHFKTPWLEDTHSFYVRTEKLEDKGQAGHTSDQQQIISMPVSVNYHVDPGKVRELYSSLGDKYVDTKLLPTFLYEVGVQTGKVTAQELITNRDVVANKIMDALKEQMEPYFIIIETVQLQTPKFNDAFEQNINDLVKQEVAVRTRILAATAEAKAIELQSASLKASPEYVKMKLAEKWDGKLPVTMLPGGAVPFIDTRAQ